MNDTVTNATTDTTGTSSTKILLQRFSIFLLLLVSLYLIISGHQVYFNTESAIVGSKGLFINVKSNNAVPKPVDEYSQPVTSESQALTHAKSDNVIPKSVGQPVTSESQVLTHAKSDNVIPKSVDQPVTPESQVLTHAKLGNITPESVDVMPENSQPITPESEVLFPYPNLTRPPHEILNSPWATEMRRKLKAAKVGKQLTYVTVTTAYFPVLLNWLVYAKLNAMPLLENLLVISTDKRPDEILSRKGILSQYVPINDIIYSKNDLDLKKLYSAKMIIRMTVLRLLNYWEYDVVLVDIDAILINNIQSIIDYFHDSDIIESSVNFRHCVPRAAYRAWNFCLCMGFMVMRSNYRTGMYTMCTVMQP